MNRFKKLMIITTIFVLVSIFVNMTVMAADTEKLEWKENWPQTIKIGGGSIGGSSYIRASAIANALKKEFPNLEIVVEQTKASVHNLMLADAGQIDIGLCTSEVAYEAWFGIGAFEGEKYNNFRLLMPDSVDTYIFVTKPEYNINTVSEFEKKKYCSLGKGSGNDLAARKVFKNLNINAEIINLPTSDAVESFKNGIIQGFSYGHPTPAIKELSLTTDIKILGLTEEEANIFIPLHPEFFYPSIIPANYYKGQTEEVKGMGHYNLVLTRVDLPDDCVNAILKAVFNNIDLVRDTWPPLADALAKDVASVSLGIIAKDVPLHPGAVKYYKDEGFDF